VPIDWPTSPATNDTYSFGGLTWRFDGSGWRLIGGPSSSVISRSTASATINLSNGATSTTTITLPKTCILVSIQADKAALVILYSSAAAATADAGRTWATTAPTAGSGVIAQVTLAAAGTQQLEKAPSAANRESTPSNTYTIRVTNNGTSGDVVVTLGYVTLEP
jgi:hypothetical protein